MYCHQLQPVGGILKLRPSVGQGGVEEDKAGAVAPDST